jgi:hypothetical protein
MTTLSPSRRALGASPSPGPEPSPPAMAPVNSRALLLRFALLGGTLSPRRPLPVAVAVGQATRIAHSAAKPTTCRRMSGRPVPTHSLPLHGVRRARLYKGPSGENGQGGWNNRARPEITAKEGMDTQEGRDTFFRWFQISEVNSQRHVSFVAIMLPIAAAVARPCLSMLGPCRPLKTLVTVDKTGVPISSGATGVREATLTPDVVKVLEEAKGRGGVPAAAAHLLLASCRSLERDAGTVRVAVMLFIYARLEWWMGLCGGGAWGGGRWKGCPGGQVGSCFASGAWASGCSVLQATYRTSTNERVSYAMKEVNV